MVLKTDLILEMVFPGNARRKMVIQITTNALQKEHKFQAIRQLYSGHNGVHVSPHYRADDVCLLFVRDGIDDVESICRHLISLWSDFSQKSDRYMKYE